MKRRRAEKIATNVHALQRRRSRADGAGDGRADRWNPGAVVSGQAKVYKDKQLVYAANTRCLCGAGMAYPKSMGPDGYWDCSDILTGRAIPSGQEGSVKHEAQLPFVFYELKSERQPSANGATTRPRS